MITRKTLINKLQNMGLDTVLFEGYRRSYNNNGSREYATLKVLEKLLDLPSVGQSHYSTKRGAMKDNPVWLTKLYTEITWSVGTIHVGDVLQHLAV